MHLSAKAKMAMQEGVFSLYYADSEVRFVDLVCEGERTTFYLDTGVINSFITSNQVKKFGKQDEVFEDEFRDSVVLNIKVKGTVFPITFEVEDNYNFNYLGLDILFAFSCTINLQDNTLTFGDYADLDITHIDFLYDTVTVEGKEAEAMADTGTAFFLTGNSEVVKELNLSLKDVSDRHYTVATMSGYVPMRYMATCRMKGKDRE